MSTTIDFTKRYSCMNIQGFCPPIIFQSYYNPIQQHLMK